MLLDIKTLIFVAVLVSLIYGIGLSLYRTHQKTFPGFSFWIASFFLLSLGYISLLIRDFAPLFLSVIVGNSLFALGALFMLDGVYRFTRGYRLRALHYSSLAVFVILISLFYFIYPNIVIRTLIIGVYAGAIAFVIAWVLITSAPESSSKFHYAAATLIGAFALALVILPTFVSSPPGDDIFRMGNRYAIYYLTALVFEIGWGVCLLMINNQRLEDELHHARRKLVESNKQLEKAVRDKITLTGLLPICAHCKKIRDDQGYWNHVESYIKSHSEADFSHGICPECARKNYPELDISED